MVDTILADLDGRQEWVLTGRLRSTYSGCFPLSRGGWRVAVVAPHEAAGLADSRRDADQLAAAEECGFGSATL